MKLMILMLIGRRQFLHEKRDLKVPNFVTFPKFIMNFQKIKKKLVFHRNLRNIRKPWPIRVKDGRVLNNYCHRFKENFYVMTGHEIKFQNLKIFSRKMLQNPFVRLIFFLIPFFLYLRVKMGNKNCILALWEEDCPPLT